MKNNKGEKKMNTLIEKYKSLTDLEKFVLDPMLGDMIDSGVGTTDLGVDESKNSPFTKSQQKGALSSLVKKGLIFTDGKAPSGYDEYQSDLVVRDDNDNFSLLV